MHRYVIKQDGALKSEVSIFISEKKALCIAVKLHPSFKQALTLKRTVFHNFTIRDISIKNNENGTVSSWW
jgi:hypothetical protein